MVACSASSERLAADFFFAKEKYFQLWHLKTALLKHKKNLFQAHQLLDTFMEAKKTTQVTEPSFWDHTSIFLQKLLTLPSQTHAGTLVWQREATAALQKHEEWLSNSKKGFPAQFEVASPAAGTGGISWHVPRVEAVLPGGCPYFWWHSLATFPLPCPSSSWSSSQAFWDPVFSWTLRNFCFQRLTHIITEVYRNEE